MNKSHSAHDQFDRLRRRNGRAPAPTGAANRTGKGALFSAADRLPEAAPALGAVTVACSSCGEATLLAPMVAARSLIPSLHLPLIKRGHPSWMRCPSCHRFTWVRLSIRL